MTISEEQLESLAQNVERHERQARRRAWYFTLVPLFFASLLLGYTVWQIQISAKNLIVVQGKLDSTNQELSVVTKTLADTNLQLQDTQNQLGQAKTDLTALQDKLTSTANELKQTEKELEQTKQELSNANVFVQNSFKIDVTDVKNAGMPLQQTLILDYILQLQSEKVGWNRTGFSEKEGFNSPDFAIYVLQHFNLISSNYHSGSKPWDILSPVTSPSIGDLIYYESGYTMFYFEIKGQKFVIGMTPLGILAQRVDFAPILGYLHLPVEPK